MRTYLAGCLLITICFSSEGKGHFSKKYGYFFPRDCQDIQWSGNTANGVYMIFPPGTGGFKVYCDIHGQGKGKGWTVIQRRFDSTENFQRMWNDYAYGFGKASSEYWIGNERIHQLTSKGWYELRVDLEDFTSSKRYADYKLFRVGDRTSGYRLTVGVYSGNAGDFMTFHNGWGFATFDRDHNACSKMYKGGFWYAGCHRANLNGLYNSKAYGQGINWFYWHGYYYSMKATTMKIRRR